MSIHAAVSIPGVVQKETLTQFCPRMIMSTTRNVVVVAGVALAGILAVLHSCLDLKATIGGSQYHNILYFLTPAMKPRMLMTVDKDMNLLPVSVRVGQAVDVVAQVRGTLCMT